MNNSKKIKCFIATSFLFVLTISSVGVIAKEVDAELDIKITEAYYTDFDKSGVKNDIVVEFKVELDVDDELIPDTATIILSLEVELTLPSGLTYVYKLKMKIIEEETDAMLVYFNHATESGWYITSIRGTIVVLGITAYDRCVFDPPGGDNGDVPRISLYY